MILTQENYYSKEANREYLSVSQYKDFCGTIGRVGCEEQALAKLNGYWEMEKTTALLVGSYVDSHFEGTLDLFKAQNPEIFNKKRRVKGRVPKSRRNHKPNRKRPFIHDVYERREAENLYSRSIWSEMESEA